MKKGFSLVELLVGLFLISIIGLVAVKFMVTAGGGGKHLEKREMQSLKSQVASDYIHSEIGSGGIAGNMNLLFLKCGAGAAKCTDAHFAVRTSEASGVIIAAGTGNVTVVPSTRQTPDGNQGRPNCPNISRMSIFDENGQHIKTTADSAANNTPAAAGNPTCTMTTDTTGVDVGDFVDFNVNHLLFKCEKIDDEKGSLTIDKNGQPDMTTNPNAADHFFASTGNTDNKVTIVEDIPTCSTGQTCGVGANTFQCPSSGVCCNISYVVDNSGAIQTNTEYSDVLNVLGAKIQIAVKKDKESTGNDARNNSIIKTIFVGRKDRN